jgi:hypothetical protein
LGWCCPYKDGDRPVFFPAPGALRVKKPPQYETNSLLSRKPDQFKQNASTNKAVNLFNNRGVAALQIFFLNKP